MGWYNKLNDYFPKEEMKKKAQLEDLIHQNPHYKKAEEDDYIVLYAEFNSFVFVDYVLVDQKARGKGVGGHILEQLKAKQKVIVLEVEPVDEDDPDTIKRERFYLSNGFTRAKNIRYYRDIGETAPELNLMEVYYWSPRDQVSEDTIREYLIEVYEDIHHFQYSEYFDRQKPSAKELVQYEDQDHER
ncbi:GNAT family N-acetyltransferase [Caldalkalibacillus salinus]|uniref:GNAT family N-acetyltransferase n=1 Tax=Caldalkalibacillus salinus TaxID=2803787 RepID=UPI001921929C|nr:GNAT family N-acetyltransferase [Caldalkalibacillus salinus]